MSVGLGAVLILASVLALLPAGDALTQQALAAADEMGAPLPAPLQFLLRHFAALNVLQLLLGAGTAWAGWRLFQRSARALRFLRSLALTGLLSAALAPVLFAALWWSLAVSQPGIAGSGNTDTWLFGGCGLAAGLALGVVFALPSALYLWLLRLAAREWNHGSPTAGPAPATESSDRE